MPTLYGSFLIPYLVGATHLLWSMVTLLSNYLTLHQLRNPGYRMGKSDFHQFRKKGEAPLCKHLVSTNVRKVYQRRTSSPLFYSSISINGVVVHLLPLSMKKKAVHWWLWRWLDCWNQSSCCLGMVHFWIYDKGKAWEEYAMKYRRVVIVIEVVFIIVILSDDVVMHLVAI